MKRVFRKIDLDTGLTLHFAEQGDPRGKAVLFLHGFPDSWNSFRPVLDLLNLKYHAFAPDLRGFGESDKPSDGYTRRDFAADILALLDALGIEKASVVGHSMGSFIAQSFAIRYPERTDKLVLIGSAASTVDNATIREILPVIEGLSDPIDRGFLVEFQTGTFYGALPAGFLETVISESLKAPSFVWKEAIKTLSEEDHRAELGKIASPTFIAWGDRDGIFPREEQYLLRDAIPRSVLKIYENAGHSLNWDHAEEFAKDAEKFLG
jgi:pimeloyl-ACP methyl ester carboxylesterase